MKTGHLFAGAGGGLYADLILGHKPVFAVEWDGYAAQCLRERANEGWFPGLHLYHGDVRMFDASEWKGRVDSIHAGFPCQDISVAGNGAGIEGDGSGLWSEVKRIAGEIRPCELFLENSPAITSRGLGTVLGDLAELGYDASWCVLPASAVGAPHIRARWWCLARLADASSGRCSEPEQGEMEQRRRTETLCTSDDSDTYGMRQLQPQGSEQNKRGRTGDICCEVSDSDKKRRNRRAGTQRKGRRIEFENSHWWAIEPALGRVANGVANRGNRIKALGNGQVPLQAAAAYTLLRGRLGT